MIRVPATLAGLATLRLAGDRRTAGRYLALVGVSSLVRAGAVLTLVPLVAALFSEAPSGALAWTAVLAILVVAGWLIDFAVARAGFAIGFELLNTIESRIVDRLQRIPLGWFTEERKAEGQRALTSSGRELCQGIAYLLTPAAGALITPALIGAGLLLVAWPLGVVALAMVPVLMGSMWASMRCLRASDESYAEASREAGQRVIELAQAQPVLRSAGRAGVEGSAIGEALARQRSAAMRLIGFGIPGQLMFGFATQAALLGVAATAVLLGVYGELAGAEIIALIIVAVRFIEPFTTLAGLFPAVQAMRGTLARVHAMLDAPVLSSESGKAGAAPDPAAPGLELRDVRFGYDAEPVLDGVSFTVASGGTAAIVGPSGAGKSTLLALIARFHDVDGGSIHVAGHDVRAYDPGTLMGRLGIVFQDVYLFDASLRDNVRVGNPHATEEQLAEAASAAQLDEVIARLPDGWDTRVAERGAALSGGERQRVSIARALLKNAPLLLLDEATAALDSANERALVRALESGSEERTTVIVAHRLSTIARADQIIFIDGGRVAESGTLAELLEREGRFAAYWRQRDQAAGWTLAGTRQGD